MSSAFASAGIEESQSSRILIIDDNPRIHRDFELVLTEDLDNPELDTDEQRLYGTSSRAALPRLKYLLDHAGSGMEGIGKVRESLGAGRPYQLAFVDLRMPGLNGVETIEQFWQVDPNVQVVICTAYADYSQEDLAARLGHTDKLLVLKKPFDNIEVTQLARTLTQKWHLGRQAALKLEQMELLVSQRTQRLLEMQQQEVERLRDLDQAKLQFLNRLARELRPPLALITETVGQLPPGGRMAAAQQELLHHQAGQLLLLVDQLQEKAGTHLMATPPLAPPDEPTAADNGEADGLTDAHDDKLSDQKQPLVLLIENNPDLAVYVKQLLGRDFKIEESPNDQDGRRKAHDLVPDIIIADIFPSAVDGVALCRDIKAAPLTSHIPIILLNTSDAGDCQLSALEAGADDYIPKAFNLSLLKVRVENLLASRRKLRTMFHQQAGIQPRDLAVNQADAHFLQRTLAAIDQNLSDFEFDVEALARCVAVSRRQLFRKLKAVVDLSPKALIRSVRLKRAAQLLLESDMTVTEITFAVGFQDVKHFRTLFKDQFGTLPSEYLKMVAPERAVISRGAS